MILQLRSIPGAEPISALLFCLQLLGVSARPASSLPSEPVLPVGTVAYHAAQVSVMPPCNETTHVWDRVRRPLRVPVFKMVLCGKCTAGAAGKEL
jgi:hypothetical protein